MECGRGQLCYPKKYHLTSISCNEFWEEHLGFFPTCQVNKIARWIYLVTGCWGWTCHLAHPTKWAPGLGKSHFTHETESLWPLHFKHSHWWKRWSWSKFGSHYAWGANGVCDCKWMWSLHGFLQGIQWIMFHGHLDYFQKTISQKYV
jgi:hypothetical protein